MIECKKRRDCAWI